MTTSQTAKPTCPPSAVVDMILTWAEVREGDLALVHGQLELVEQDPQVFTIPDGDEPTATLLLEGRPTALTVWAGEYTAVKRYDTGEDR